MTNANRPLANEAEVTPDKLLDLSFSFAGERVLSTAVQLDVFSALAQGNRAADAVAQATGCSRRGMPALLDALVGFGLVGKLDGGYELTPLSARYLVRESPDYLGHMWETNRLWELWGRLADSARTGRSQTAVNQQQGAEEFFPILVRSLHIQNRAKAQTLAQRLVSGHKGLHGIDIACGSGVWGIAVCEADPQARFVAQDFPAVLDLTRRYLRQHGVEDRYEFLPGNLREVDFGRDRFDLALLGNIVHSEGESSSRSLFQRLCAALRPGGRIVIIDMVPNDARTGPVFPLLFALNMLVATEEGGTYTLAEYTDWLCQAGFTTVETMDIGSHSPAIMATKA